MDEDALWHALFVCAPERFDDLISRADPLLMWQELMADVDPSQVIARMSGNPMEELRESLCAIPLEEVLEGVCIPVKLEGQLDPGIIANVMISCQQENNRNQVSLRLRGQDSWRLLIEQAVVAEFKELDLGHLPDVLSVIVGNAGILRDVLGLIDMDSRSRIISACCWRSGGQVREYMIRSISEGMLCRISEVLERHARGGCLFSDDNGWPVLWQGSSPSPRLIAAGI
jgi:hypothetical protein